jgi:hypothetical protein
MTKKELNCEPPNATAIRPLAKALITPRDRAPQLDRRCCQFRSRERRRCARGADLRKFWPSNTDAERDALPLLRKTNYALPLNECSPEVQAIFEGLRTVVLKAGEPP